MMVLESLAKTSALNRTCKWAIMYFKQCKKLKV